MLIGRLAIALVIASQVSTLALPSRALAADSVLTVKKGRTSYIFSDSGITHYYYLHIGVETINDKLRS